MVQTFSICFVVLLRGSLKQHLKSFSRFYSVFMGSWWALGSLFHDIHSVLSCIGEQEVCEIGYKQVTGRGGRERNRQELGEKRCRIGWGKWETSPPPCLFTSLIIEVLDILNILPSRTWGYVSEHRPVKEQACENFYLLSCVTNL